MSINRCQACGTILEPSARVCGRCGAKLSALPLRRRRREGRFEVRLARVLWLVAAVLVVAGAWLILKRSEGERSVSTPAPASAAPALPELDLSIVGALRSKFPDLHLYWKDSAGRRYVSVPKLFWNSMLPSERVRFARELDQLYPDRDWMVVTGRYFGGSVMRMATGYQREPLLSGEAVAYAPVRKSAGAAPRPSVPPPPSPPPPRPRANRPPGLPDYEILFAIDAFHSNRRYAEVLIPSLNPRADTSELRRVARAVAEFEEYDDLTVYCTREARQAHYSMEYADRNPDALDQGLLGSLEGGRFKRHRISR